MNKLKYIINQRFGQLTVLKKSDKKGKYGEIYWDCICDCGKEKTASGNNLKSMKIKSCGCLRKKSKPNKHNLIGCVFGRLTVISESKQIIKNRPRWTCKCSCGNVIDVCGSELRKGNIKSCKCLQRELASNRRKINQLGSKNASYNPLLTDEDRISRRYVKGYKEWSFSVKLKANFTCEFCGDNTGGNLVSHHLYAYMKFKELRLNVDNGSCLCESCHNEFHKKYGWGENTKEQYIEWLNEKQTIIE